MLPSCLSNTVSQSVRKFVCLLTATGVPNLATKNKCSSKRPLTSSEKKRRPSDFRGKCRCPENHVPCCTIENQTPEAFGDESVDEPRLFSIAVSRHRFWPSFFPFLFMQFGGYGRTPRAALRREEAPWCGMVARQKAVVRMGVVAWLLLHRCRL